jgi:hypothetical protein
MASSSRPVVVSLKGPLMEIAWEALPLESVVNTLGEEIYFSVPVLKPEYIQKYHAEKRRSGLSAQTVRHHQTLGHSSIQITLDIYSHVTPGLQEAAAKRFDDAMQIKHNETVEKSVYNSRKTGRRKLIFSFMRL